ncbi:collagen-like protein, partial [Pyxidicoccus sp. 3LG]
MNSDGVLQPGEVNAASTKYLCDGAPGAQGVAGPAGVQGPAGPTGERGPTGEAGALALYGDGSAGDLHIRSTDPLRNLAIGYGILSQGANLMFRNVTIEGTLIVASGTTIRATGDITIGSGGTIAANPEAQVQTLNPPQTGTAISAASSFQGGRGLDLGRSSLLTRFDLRGGGSGFRTNSNPNISQGGEGGGRLILAARGNVTVQGQIEVEGRDARNLASTGAGVAGGGGGGGGVVTIVSRGTITVGTNGLIRANGGDGANGVSGAAGAVYGGGGGGGGGIVQFLSANPTVIATPANIQVAGGAAGAVGASGAATTFA